MSADPDVPWDLVSQVKRSDTRAQIVNHLAREPHSATELADKIGIQTATASNYLRDLKNMDPPVAECITPNQPHHRLYALTEVGVVVQQNI